MRREQMMSRTAWGLSLLLGQASVLLGIMVAIGWTLALVVVLPPKALEWASGPRMLLPIEPPLIGLALGAVGLLIARVSRQPIARFSVAGMIFNAVPLVLAIVLILCRIG